MTRLLRAFPTCYSMKNIANIKAVFLSHINRISIMTNVLTFLIQNYLPMSGTD